MAERLRAIRDPTPERGAQVRGRGMIQGLELAEARLCAAAAARIRIPA